MGGAERLLVYFSGRVQGVGFRYTAIDIARKFPALSGYVRNAGDGRVELVAEGASHDLDAFVAAVNAAMEGYVAKVEITRTAPTKEFSGFTIRR